MFHRQIVVGAAWALPDDYIAAAVAQVLCLCMSLGTVTEDGDGLVFEKGQVGIVVVVNRGWHLCVTPVNDQSDQVSGMACFPENGKHLETRCEMPLKDAIVHRLKSIFGKDGSDFGRKVCQLSQV